ncbi:MAG: helix-turn-helix domain-containing protein, partial [Bacteroidales bacterium]|nr:helix-turn-helix domain-containing protein [Bacteroidales bacterium]
LRGESQSSIARRLGVTRSTLALWIKRDNVLI